MRFLLPLALAAALGLSACGAGEEAGPASTAPEAEPAPAAVPAAARVTCTEDGIDLETPVTAPQPDGVHLIVVNETGAEIAFSVSGAESGLGFSAPPGETEEVIDLGPGAYTVGCDQPATGSGPSEPLTIADPEGLWVPTDLPCPEQFSQVTDYMAGAKGETSDPLEAARTAVEAYGLEPDDVFEPAGYPEASSPAVRLVRGGAPLAVVHLFDDGEGKWLAGTVTGCSSLQD
jgi:hypothetical protein